MPPARAAAMVVVAMASLMAGAALAKSLFPVAGPAGVAAARLVFAAAILAAIRRPWRRSIPRAARWPLIAYGLSIGGMNLLIYAAMSRIPVGVAVALEFLGPLGVAVAASRRAADFLWALLAAGGVALLLPLPGAAEPLDGAGVLFALLGAACWAAYIVAGRRVAAAVDGGAATAVGMVVAAALALPFGAASAGPGLFAPGVLLTVLAVAVLSSVVPYSLEMAALRSLPARTFGVLMSLEPALGAVAAALMLGERLTAAQWAAVGAVVLASAGSAATARKGVGDDGARVADV